MCAAARSDPAPHHDPDHIAELETSQLSGGHLPAWIQDSPYWLIAVLVHVIGLFIFGTIVMLEAVEEEHEIITIVRLVPEEKVYKPLPHTTLYDTPPIDQPPSPHVKMETKVKPVEQDRRKAEKPKPMAELGLFGDPDLSWGAPAVGTPTGGVPGGGNNAVRAALEWLKRHQHPDGHWSSHGFHENCNSEEHGALCNFTNQLDSGTGTDSGFEGYDVGVTGLALLAIVGFGYTHTSGEDRELRECVRRGVQWLIAEQVHSTDPALDGLFCTPSETTDEWIYNHAIATLAMADLLLSSRQRLHLTPPTQSAVNWCLRAQNPGFGWKYGYQTGKNDTSVTGWMVFALKSAKACGHAHLIKFDKAEFETAFAGAIAWIEAVTSSHTGITGYEAPGDEGSRLQKVHGENYPYSKELSCMTAVGVLTRVFAGQGRRTDAMRAAVSHLVGNLPEWRPTTGKRQSKINFYSWYYATYALYQIGGAPWKKWVEALAPTMVDNQRKLGCEDGSWDPIGEWGCAGGRVYSTAMGALILEVYDRSRR